MLAILAAMRDEVSDYLSAGGFAALPQDEGPCLYRSPSRPEVMVVEAGIGRERAQRAVRYIIEHYHPDALLSVGFAGAVRPEFGVGDVLVCDRLFAVDGPPEQWQPDRAQCYAVQDRPLHLKNGHGLGYPSCGCLTAPVLVASRSLKRRIGESFPVAVVDMEGYWVGEAAASSRTPHMVARCVLDTAGQSLPAFVTQVVSSNGRRSWGDIARYVLARPTDLPTLVHLGVQARAARAALARFLSDVTGC